MHWAPSLSVVALRRVLCSSFGMVTFCVGCGFGRINMFRQANCPVLYACTGRREPVASDGSMWSFTLWPPVRVPIASSVGGEKMLSEYPTLLSDSKSLKKKKVHPGLKDH